MFESEESNVTQNPQKSVIWYRQAVDEGDANARFYLGRLMLDESLKEYDPVQALHWLQWTAMQGEMLFTK